MEEQKAMQAFVDHMLRYTVNLVRVVPNQWPVGIASGFIIPVEKWYRIISAGHAIAAKPNWAIETVPVSASETLMLTVKNVRALATISPGDPTNALDLAWADLFPDELRSQLAEAPRNPSPQQVCWWRWCVPWSAWILPWASAPVPGDPPSLPALLL